MGAFTLIKVAGLGGNPGQILPVGAAFQAYYPSAIDTSTIPNWPWTITVFASHDHSSGGSVGIYGAVGDPTVAANWENYEQALAAGRFNAFPVKPANNIILQYSATSTETPQIVKIGSTYYLTAHVGLTGSNQPTMLATSTDLLNWTYYNRGDGFPWNLDGALEVKFANFDAHRGYFRWGLSVFPDFPYTYYGMGLYGGGSRPNTCIRGSNDGTTWFEYSLCNDFLFEDLTLPAGWGIKWSEYSPESVRDAGGGEYCFIVPCGDLSSGAATRYSDLYEVFVGRDGHTLTRKPRLLLSRGGAGSSDENELGQPTMVEYGGQMLVFYQGTNAGDQNSLHLAIATWDNNAAKSPPVARPNHDKFSFNQSAGSFPSWISVAAGVPTFPGGYVNMPTNSGIMYNTDIVPDTVEYIESYIETTSGGSATSVPYVTVAANVNLAQNGIQLNSFSANTFMASRVANADVNLHTSPFIVGGEMEKINKFGFRWYVPTDKLILLTGTGDQYGILDVPGAPSSLSLRPRVGAATQAMRLVSWVLRLGNPASRSSTGVAPTVTGAVAAPTLIDFSLSETCIGDCWNVSIYDNGVSVDGTWSRPSLSTMRFTKTSGNFVGPLTYSIANTDVRNSADLVAIQNVSDVPISYTPPDPSSSNTGMIRSLITNLIYPFQNL